ncbi:MAG: DMT family transporter [Clostridium sp.]|nr:DMT family transporter [Clostridium sp.]
MLGIILSVLSGLCMSVQGVFNSRLSDKIGTVETNVFVQGTAFILSVIILIFYHKNNFKNIKNVNFIFLSGGILAVIITYTVMKGISSLGTTHAISLILLSQLTSAAVIDAFGLFGAAKINFGLNEIIGVIMIFIGIVIFKWN